ncbi:MAG TPA: hypothetical protein VKJ45_12515 [Blastocatellia bacterium]|nr:hypothetical protein [Blastocatellia bacterium]
MTGAVTPLLGPDGQVHSVPNDQVQAAIAAGGKKVSKMFDPTGTLRWVSDDQREDAIRAGGTLVNADGTYTVTPYEGESFADTMQRAARIGKNVTPDLIRQQTITGMKETPLALGAAATAGIAGPATLAGIGEAGAAIPGAMTQAGNAASLLWNSPVVQTAARMMATKAIGGAATAVGMAGAYKFMRKIGLLKGLTGAAE